MMNIIRADIYRIVRGKGLYITLAVFLAVIILQIVSGANMNAGVNVNVDVFELVDMENFDVNDLAIADFFHSPTGAEAAFQAMEASSNILYFVLPLIIFIGAADFSSGAAKNTLSGGISRLTYYCAKLVLSCVCCVLLLVFYIVLSALTATVVNGFGGVLNGEYVLSVVKIFLPQLWLCLAVVCVGNLLVFAFQRPAAVNGLYIAFLLIPSLLILTLSFISERFEKLVYYDLAMNIGALVQIDSMPTGDITRIFIIGMCYIIAAFIGGFAIFRRTEIK